MIITVLASNHEASIKIRGSLLFPAMMRLAAGEFD
jgi:hypothetical protein